MGLSTIHSSEVPLVLLNLETGSVTQQYHVVFDDRYSTVASINVDDKPPSDWEDLCLEKSLHVPTDDMPAMPPHLHDDWLTDAELLHRDAIDHIRAAHGALVVRDDDELRVVDELVQHLEEAGDVRFIERRIKLIENAER